MSYENKDRDLDTPMEWGRDNDLDRDTSKSRDVGPATMWAGAGEVGSESVDQVILEPKRLSMIRVVALTVIMILTYFLGAVSSQAVTLNVPGMSRDLNLTQLQAQWVVSAYSLAYACGLLFSGRIADVYGRKLCFLIGMGVFVVFSIISGVMRTYIPLCILRALAGLGMALAGPSGFGIVGAYVVHEPVRTIVFAAFGLGGPIGAATGTLLGGAVAAINAPRNWSYLFYVLAGLGAIPLVLGYFAMPWDRRALTGSKVPKIDWIGGFLVTSGLSLFMFSLTQSGVVEKGWSEPYVPVVFVLSICLLVAFLLWERHLENKTSFPPIAKFSLFTRHRYRFTALMLCAFFCTISTSGFVYTATIWYQELKGETPLKNAILLLPCNIMGLGAAGAAMYTVPRVKAPYLIATGGTMAGMTSILYATCPAYTLYWKWEFVAQLCLPWGIDFIVCVGNVLVTNLVASDEQSVGGALFQTSYTVGFALGNNLSSLLIQRLGNDSGDLLHGLRASSGLNAACAWIIPIIALIGLRGLGVASDAAKVVTK